ncbi:MAG: hypothetical protein LBG46_02810 [Elusimicrobiota bacterium]|jgi:hypothetical protein|nr:hypothetical protein [Elusimicrobiota bacterium]
MTIYVARPIEGIGLNGNEYLLGEDNKAMKFKTRKEAKEFLKSHNYPLDDVMFEEEEEE